MLNTGNNGGMSYNMPVQPAYYGGNGGFGDFGGGWMFLWLIAMICGWGGFGGMGGGMWPMMMGGGMGGWGMNMLYPWLDNSQNINDGFRSQALQSSVDGLRGAVDGGFRDVLLGQAGTNQAICQTGNTITGAVRDGFSAAEIAANGRQMANMQQGFGIQSGIADLKYTVATEACADRNAVSQALNTVLTHVDQKIQGVNDKLCQLELDGYKQQLAASQRENLGLQNQLNMAAFRESQANQNALFAQGMTNEVDALYNRLKNCPVNTVPVAGNTPLFSCNPSFNNPGCGCQGGNGFGYYG